MNRVVVLASALLAVLFVVLSGCQSAAPQPAPTQSAAQKASATQPAAQPAAPQPTASQPTPAAAKSAASGFPSRPIEYVVPFAPGGGSGITAETINKIITEEKLCPQPINISYKPGANGAIGHAYVSGRRGDPHVIAAATSSFVAGYVTGSTPLKPTEDFSPIALMAVDELLMVTSTQSPLKSVQDVVEAAKKAPKSVKVAVTSATGSEAVAAALLDAGAGIKLNVIPFNSGAEVNAAILGNQVELAISNPNELFPNIEAGKLRPLVVFGESRMSVLKDVPTLKDLGYPGRIYNPRGIIAPPGIPKDAEQWLIELMKKVTESKGWKEYADKNMMTVKFLGGSDYSKFLKDEEKMYTEIYTGMGVLKK